MLKSDPERPSHDDCIHFIVYNSTTSCVRFFINFFITCYIFDVHLFSPDITVLYRILTVSIQSSIRNTAMILLNVTYVLSYSSLCSKMMKTTLMIEPIESQGSSLALDNFFLNSSVSIEGCPPIWHAYPRYHNTVATCRQQPTMLDPLLH